MAIVTNITPWHVAIELGQPAPKTYKNDQWEQFITDTVMFIQKKADSLAITELDQVVVDFVVRQVVADQQRRLKAIDNPDYDGRPFKTVADWWPLLGLDGGLGEAFEIDMFPSNGGPQAWKYLSPSSDIVL